MQDHYKSILTKIEGEIEKSYLSLPNPDRLRAGFGPAFTHAPGSILEAIHGPGALILQRGGKRWRPLLMYQAAEFYGDVSTVIPLTPIVEIPHNGTLIVDDIEDKSPERRGGPAAHLLFGEDHTINSGNYMYFQPLDLIDRASISDHTRLHLYQAYSETMRRLHLGQGMDIFWHNHTEIFPSENEYLMMCRGKTGSLASFAARAGAVLGGADWQEAAKLGEIWQDLGVAFQILDDVLNLSRGNPGKMRGDDIIEGKKSLPVILFAEQHDPGELAARFEEVRIAHQHQKDLRNPIAKALAILETSNCIDQAREAARGMIDRGIEALSHLEGKDPARKAMIRMVEEFWKKMA